MAKLAVIQLVTEQDISYNFKHIEQGLQQAQKKDAVIAVLPEECLTVSLHPKARYLLAEDYQDGPLQARMQNLAKQYNMWLVAGTMPIKCPDSDKIYARTIVWDNQGEVQGYYDKIHLFDVNIAESSESYTESDYIQAGQTVQCVDSPVGKLGLSICYDLRFPELYRHLMFMGAEVLLVPAAFTFATGKAHWQLLLKARAIENLAYCVGAAQAGVRANGHKTYGHSMVASFWGDSLVETAEGFKVIVADIDLNTLRQRREQFPVLQHVKQNFVRM